MRSSWKSNIRSNPKFGDIVVILNKEENDRFVMIKHNMQKIGM